MSATALHDKGATKRSRQLITPEGLALPLTVASRGARAGALLLDLTFICIAIIVFLLALAALGIGLLSMDSGSSITSGPLELLGVIVIMFFFLARYAYFMIYELGARGATPGKRILGIRVAARDGGKLTADMVIARNLVRDVEVFIPTFFLIGGGHGAGIAGLAAFVWLAVFVLFPFTNRDALRAGDLVAGTWVVEAKARQIARRHVASARSQHHLSFRARGAFGLWRTRAASARTRAARRQRCGDVRSGAGDLPQDWLANGRRR